MAEKAVIIGLFGGLLVSAGLIWAKMPPRPEIHYSHLRQAATGAAPTKVIAIDKPKPVELPAWAEHHPISQQDAVSPPQYEPKEVMPSESINNRPNTNNRNNIPETRPRQVLIPKRRPVGAVNRPHCICKTVRRPILLLPQANGGTL